MVLKKNVFFIMGYYGVGKSAIVRKLAEHLGIGFFPKAWIHTNVNFLWNPDKKERMVSIVGRYSKDSCRGTDGSAEIIWKHVFGAIDVSHTIVVEGYWFTTTSKLVSNLQHLKKKGYELILIELQASIEDSKQRYYKEQKKLSEKDYDIHQKNVARRINKMEVHVDQTVLVDASGTLDETWQNFLKVWNKLE